MTKHSSFPELDTNNLDRVADAVKEALRRLTISADGRLRLLDSLIQTQIAPLSISRNRAHYSHAILMACYIISGQSDCTIRELLSQAYACSAVLYSTHVVVRCMQMSLTRFAVSSLQFEQEYGSTGFVVSDRGRLMSNLVGKLHRCNSSAKPDSGNDLCSLAGEIPVLDRTLSDLAMTMYS